MIKINERFSMKRDPYCWILYEYKKEKKTSKQTYHANFEQIAYTILNHMAGDCESIAELIKLYTSAETIITTQLEEKIKPRGKKKNEKR